VIENAIFLAALAEIPDFLAKMVGENNRHFLRLGEAVIKQLREESDANPDAAEIQAILDEFQSGGAALDSVKLEQIASRVEMGKIYNLYREISGDSAHPSLLSTERHIRRDATGRVSRLLFLPQRDGLTKVLYDTCGALLGALEAAGRVFGREDIQQLVEAYCARIDKEKSLQR
jgi:hypothetical protein